jgi:hypothetical protein
MTTNDDSKADAEKKMNAAQAALLAYVESKEHDPALQERLIEEVNGAIADYVKLVGVGTTYLVGMILDERVPLVLFLSGFVR